MSKFCGNCGAKMDDSATVCGYCGTAFTDTKPKKFKYEDPEKKAKTKNLIKKCAVVVIAVVVIAIIGNIISSFTGYKGTVRTFMKAYRTENIDTLVDMTCSFMQDEEYINVVANRFDNKIKSDFDSYDYHFDSKYSIKYEIVDATKLSDRQAKNKIEELSYSGYFSMDDADLVKKVMNVKVSITAKHGSDKMSVTRTIYFAKESGGWKLLSFE